MENQRGRRSVPITALSVCVFTATVLAMPGCGSVRETGENVAAFKALPDIDEIPGALAYRFLAVREGEDLDIGAQPE